MDVIQHVLSAYTQFRVTQHFNWRLNIILWLSEHDQRIQVLKVCTSQSEMISFRIDIHFFRYERDGLVEMQRSSVMLARLFFGCAPSFVDPDSASAPKQSAPFATLCLLQEKQGQKQLFPNWCRHFQPLGGVPHRSCSSASKWALHFGCLWPRRL